MHPVNWRRDIRTIQPDSGGCYHRLSDLHQLKSNAKHRVMPSKATELSKSDKCVRGDTRVRSPLVGPE
jgi:hypothetical protein